VEVSADDGTSREARIFARYLVGRVPPPSLVARYREATRIIWPTHAPVDHDPLLTFVRRHPWSLGPLDAATSLLQPGAALRARILTMAAILEASPEFADDFLPRGASASRLVWTVVTAGAVTTLHAVAGLALLPVARRARR
jgi:hypothetical protein